MSILIKGMEMLTTGLFFVGVDNANGRDKTVITVERMLGNRDVRQIVGSYELVPVPPHGRLIDADALLMRINHEVMEAYMDGACYGAHPSQEYLYLLGEIIDDAPTIVEAEEGE